MKEALGKNGKKISNNIITKLEANRIKLRSDEVIIRIRQEKDNIELETIKGENTSEFAFGLAQNIMVVITRAEGVKELMGLARKLIRTEG